MKRADGVKKKRFKWFVFIPLIVSLIVAAIPAFSASAVTEDGFTYAVSNGKATLTDYNGAAGGIIIIPDLLGGSPLAEIGASAFMGNTSIQSVELPDGVSKIGQGAFAGCSSMSEIFFGKGLQRIGYTAFSGCTSLTSVKIPDSVFEISDSAFSGCTSLTDVILPEGMEVNATIFEGCTRLMGNSQPTASEASYGGEIFGYTVVNGKVTITAHESGSSVVIIPATIDGCAVVAIAKRVFAGDEYLESLTLPDGLKTIGDEAFAGCTRLSDLNIPGSVTEVGAGICENTKCEAEIDGALYVDNWLVSATGSTLIICGDTVGIASRAFSKAKVSELVIPDCVKTLCNEAFYGNSYIKKVKLSGVTAIGSSAFAFCKNLTGINIPDSVTTIRDNAFLKTSLTEITIPDSVTKIGDYAFGFNEKNMKTTGFTVYGYLDTQAQVYAVNNALRFVSLGKALLAEDVSKKIEALGKITLKSEAAINTARADYNALPQIKKEAVTNYPTLVVAEGKLYELKNGAKLMEFTFSGGGETVNKETRREETAKYEPEHKTLNNSSADALITLRISVGKEHISDDKIPEYDVNNDRKIGSADALIILQNAVKENRNKDKSSTTEAQLEPAPEVTSEPQISPVIPEASYGMVTPDANNNPAKTPTPATPVTPGKPGSSKVSTAPATGADIF